MNKDVKPIIFSVCSIILFVIILAIPLYYIQKDNNKQYKLNYEKYINTNFSSSQELLLLNDVIEESYIPTIKKESKAFFVLGIGYYTGKEYNNDNNKTAINSYLFYWKDKKNEYNRCLVGLDKVKFVIINNNEISPYCFFNIKKYIENKNKIIDRNNYLEFIDYVTIVINKKYIKNINSYDIELK